MAKFIKRLGTKAYKYAVDVYIDKVYIDIPIASRLKVTLKRGSHTAETKSLPAIEDGVAIFGETLSISATLYHDKKRNAFLPKEGLLKIISMASQGSKTVGHVKFNIADVPTLKLQERTYDWPILDCVDSKAHVQATVKMTLVSEITTKTEHHSDEESKHVSWGQNQSAVMHKEESQVKNLARTMPEVNSILKNPQRSTKAINESRTQKNIREMNILSGIDEQTERTEHKPNPVMSSINLEEEDEPKRMQTSQEMTQSKYSPYVTQGADLYKEKFNEIDKKLESITTEKTNAELKLTEVDNNRLLKRIEELESKNQHLDREKIDFLLKISNLEEKVVKYAALQKENATLIFKNKELENRLRNIDLTSYEEKIAEYEEMIRALREERSSSQSGDLSALELEKLRKNLAEMEALNRRLKSEKEQIESNLKRETTQLRVENVSLKTENERISRLLQEAKKLLEEKEHETNRIRNENLDLKAFLKEYDVLNLKKALTEAQKALATITQEKERSEKSLLQIIDKLTNEYQELQAQLDGTSTNTNWSNAKRDTESSIQRLRKENESLQRKFQDQIAKLYKEKQDLEVFLKDVQTEDTRQLALDSVVFSEEPNRLQEGDLEEFEKLRQYVRMVESHNKNLSTEKDEAIRKSFEFESQTMRLRQKIEELEKERIRAYEEKIQLQEILNQEKEDYERRLLRDKEELEKKVDELLKEREELSRNYRMEVQKLTREKEENAHKMKEILQQLEEKNLHVMKIKVESEKKMRESDVERWRLSTSENKLKMLNDENKALIDENEILVHEKKELSDQIAQIERENERLLKQQDEAQERVNSLKREIELLQIEIKVLNEKNKKVEDIDAMIEHFAEEENELKGELEAKEKEINELKERVEELTNELSDVEHVKQENESLKADNEKLKELYVQSKSKVDIEKLEGKIAEYEAEIENLKNENSEYKSQIEGLQKEIEGLNKEIETLRKEIEDLKEKNQTVEELEEKLSVIEAAKSKLESQNLKLQDEAANMRNEWLEADKKNTKLVSNLRVLEETEKNLNAKLSQISQELITAKTNLGDVMNIVFELGSGDVIDAIESRVLTKES